MTSSGSGPWDILSFSNGKKNKALPREGQGLVSSRTGMDVIGSWLLPEFRAKECSAEHASQPARNRGREGYDRALIWDSAVQQSAQRPEESSEGHHGPFCQWTVLYTESLLRILGKQYSQSPGDQAGLW